MADAGAPSLEKHSVESDEAANRRKGNVAAGALIAALAAAGLFAGVHIQEIINLF